MLQQLQAIRSQPLSCLILLSLHCIAWSASFAKAEVISEEMKTCFTWLESRGFPDVKEAQFVNIRTGFHMHGGSNSHGFLLDEDDAQFTILTLDLVKCRFDKKIPDPVGTSWLNYEDVKFLDFGKSMLRVASDDRLSSSGLSLGTKTCYVFMAYVCWRKGYYDLANQLFSAAEGIQSQHVQDHPHLTTVKVMEFDLAHQAMWEAMLRVGGNTFSDGLRNTGSEFEARSDLIKRFESILTLYPGTPHCGRINEILKVLKQMVKEDREHDWLSTDEIAKLPVEKQTQEWIFRLRDQSGQNGGVFGYTPKSHRPPAYCLVDIGYPAVPFLIEAVGDKRYSRSVDSHRDFSFSDRILTIGECAYQILREITGEYFGELSEEEINDTQGAARDWWLQFQEKGEVQITIDRITAGDDPLLKRSIELLAIKKPNSLEQFLLQGLSNSKQHYLREGYIRNLAKYRSNDTVNALSQIMLDDEYDCRMAAAKILIERNYVPTARALTKEFHRFLHKKNHLNNFDFEKLIRLFIPLKDGQGMQEIISNWDNLSISQKIIVIKFSALAKDDPKAKNLALRLLTSALEDLTEVSIYTGYMAGKRIINPRLADYALCALFLYDKERFYFSHNARPFKREIERVNALNTVRSEKGLEPLALPNSGTPVLPVDKANQISVVKIKEYGVKSNELINRFQNLSGKTISADSLTNLFTWYADNEVRGCRGFEVHLLRESGLRGIRADIVLLPGTYADGVSVKWRKIIDGDIDSQPEKISFTQLSIDDLRKPNTWNELNQWVPKIFVQSEPKNMASLRIEVSNVIGLPIF